jgi:hypothetical protein
MVCSSGPSRHPVKPMMHLHASDCRTLYSRVNMCWQTRLTLERSLKIV